MTVSIADVQTYLVGLRQGAQLQSKAVTPITQQNRAKALQEFSTWLASHVKCRNLGSCLPEEFVVYLTTYWAGQHACQSTHGSGSAAPVSVNALVSHLAVELDKLGRVGPWQRGVNKGVELLSSLFPVQISNPKTTCNNPQCNIWACRQSTAQHHRGHFAKGLWQGRSRERI